jgi:hypothetical protein
VGLEQLSLFSLFRCGDREDFYIVFGDALSQLWFYNFFFFFLDIIEILI